MSVGRLFDVDLATFEQESAAPDALWLFLHIPKTAGSSLSAELDDIRPPYRNIHMTDDDYRRTDVQGEAFWGLLDRHIDRMLADHETMHFRSASGHMLAPQAMRIAESIPQTRLFTFLRNPVARVISDYRYQRSDLHPQHAEFAEAHPTIESYLPTADANKMFRHLCLHREEPVDEVIDRVTQTFAFVGLVEMYPFSFNVLTHLFGDDRMPARHERVATPETASVLEVTSAMRDDIAERNTKDLAIYEHFHRMMLPHRDAWREVLQRYEADSEQTTA